MDTLSAGTEVLCLLCPDDVLRKREVLMGDTFALQAIGELDSFALVRMSTQRIETILVHVDPMHPPLVLPAIQDPIERGDIHRMSLHEAFLECREGERRRLFKSLPYVALMKG